MSDYTVLQLFFNICLHQRHENQQAIKHANDQQADSVWVNVGVDRAAVFAAQAWSEPHSL